MTSTYTADAVQFADYFGDLRPLDLLLVVDGVQTARNDLHDAEDWVAHCASGWKVWRALDAELDDAATLTDAELSPDAPDFADMMRRRLGDRQAMCRREAASFLDKWRAAVSTLMGIQTTTLKATIATLQTLDVPAWEGVDNAEVAAANEAALAQIEADLADLANCMPAEDQ